MRQREIHNTHRTGWLRAAVLMGVAATHLMPEGHPAPLMVKSPWSYETRDYLKFGTGLVAITLVIVAVLVPLLWPF